MENNKLNYEGPIYDNIYSKAKIINIIIQHSITNKSKGYTIPGVGIIRPEILGTSKKLDIPLFIDIEKLDEIIKNEKDINQTKFNIKFTEYNEKYDPIKLTNTDKELIFKLAKLYINTECNITKFFNRINGVMTKNTSWTGHLFDHYKIGEGPGGEKGNYNRDIISAFLYHKEYNTSGNLMFDLEFIY